jgi:hypothetical protein
MTRLENPGSHNEPPAAQLVDLALSRHRIVSFCRAHQSLVSLKQRLSGTSTENIEIAL